MNTKTIIKHKLLCLAAAPMLALLTLVFATGAQAASINWGTATTIAGDTDVSTSGTLAYAYDDQNVATTVNGVPFAAGNTYTAFGANVTMSGFTANITSTFAGGTGLSAAYTNALAGGAYGSSAATITLNNLTVGHAYLVQVWVNDSRTAGSNRNETITSAGGNTVTLAYNNTGLVGGLGQYTIGTFTATATTQSFTLTGNNTTQLNAIQVRDKGNNTAYFSGASGTAWDASTTADWGTTSGGPYNNTWTAAGGASSLFAIFEGTAANVGVSGTINVGGITFNTDGYALGGSGALTLGSTGGAITTGSGTDTISNALSGTVGLTKFGSGMLILAGANNYSGTTTVAAGTLVLSGANTISGATTLASGTLQLANAGALTSSALTMSPGTTLQLRANSGVTFAPASVSEAGSSGTVTYNFDVNSITSGTGNTLVLANVATQFGPAGTTDIFNLTGGNNYTLQIGGGSAGAGGLNIWNNTTINSSTAGVTLSIPGGITVNYNSTYSLTLGGAGNLSFGPLVNPQTSGGQKNLTPTFGGSGTISLNGVNNFGAAAGTISSTGVLALNNNGALNGLSTLALSSAVTLDNTSGSLVTISATPAQTWSSDFTFGTANTAGNLNLGTGTVTLSAARKVTIANANYALTVGGVISGSSIGLAKAGAGTLILTNVNTYSGATTITNGRLFGVTGGSSASSAVTVQSTGTGNTATLGVLYTGGNTQWTCSSLTTSAGVGGGNGPVLEFAFNTTPSATTAPLKVTGTATFTATPTVKVDLGNISGLSSGTVIPLMVVGGTVPGTPNLTIVGGYSGSTLAWSGNTLNLTLAGSSTEPLKWATSTSGTWDNNDSANTPWKNTSATATYYQEPVGGSGDQVIFDETYINANTTVTLNSVLNPTSVAVTNSTYNYTISGGGISGATSLTKAGTATLTLSNANTYSGGTTISAGTVQAGVANAIPGNKVGGDVSVTGTLDLNTYSDSINGLNGSGTVDTVAGGTPTLTVGANGDSGSFSGIITNSAGALSLTKAGSGTQTLSGANTYSGATTISGGTLSITGTSSGGGTNAITGSGTTLTINSSGTVSVSGLGLFPSSGLGEALNLNGGIFKVGSGGIQAAANGGNFNFNGGTLKSSAPFSISGSIPIPILAGGGTVDTAGGNITSSSGFGYTGSTGTGTFTIQGGNTFQADFANGSTWTGPVVVTGNSTLQNHSTAYAISGALNVGSGSTFDLNNVSASFGGLTGAGTVTNSNSSATHTLTVTGTGGKNFSGAIVGGTTAFTVNLTSGTQTNSGANTYAGTTTLSGGVLNAGSAQIGTTSGPLGVGGNIVFGGGTLQFSSASAGWDPSARIAAGTTSGNIKIDANGQQLSFASALTSSQTGGLTLTDTAGSGGKLALNGANAYSGATTVSGGELDIFNWSALNNLSAITVGNAATTGILGIYGGTLTLASTVTFTVGTGTSSAYIGIVNQTNGSVTFTSGTGNALLIGNGSGSAGANGTYNLSGGTLTGYSSASRGVMLGVNTGCTATFNLSGTGNLALGTGELAVGRDDSGVAGCTVAFQQNGGTATVGYLSIGGGQSGSTTTTATFAITNGTFVASSFQHLAAAGSSTATLYLGGGAQVTLPAFPTRGGTANITFDFTNGWLAPVAASTSYMPAGTFNNAYLTTNGVNFNVGAGTNITVAQVLSDATSQAGALTKSGAGTLVLNGVNTYSGPTTVTGGKLQVLSSQTGTGNITVSDGADLAVTVAGPSLSPNTLTLGTGTAGVNLEFNNVTNPSVAPINAGTLAHTTGTVTITVNSGIFAANTTNLLIAWGSGTAPATSLNSSTLLALGITSANLITNGNTISLVVNQVADIWTGINGSVWDIATTTNWTGQSVVYHDGDYVLFGDTAAGTKNVTVTNVVSPGGIAVNTTNTYVITNSATAFIGGSSPLIKSGTGTLVMVGGNNTNNGVTTINGGIVSVGVLALGGAPSDLGSSASSAANLILNGGTLQYTGPGATSDRLFTLGAAGGSLDASGSGALNLNNGGSVAFSGSGTQTLTLTGTNTAVNILSATIGDGSGGATTLAKTGTGLWNLTAANTYSGGTTISAGTLQLGAGNAIPSPSTPNTGDVNLTGGTLDLNGNSAQINGLNGASPGVVDSLVGSSPTLTLGANGDNGTFNGVIQDSNGGNLTLVKNGAGNQNLGGANTYDNGTIINTGSLTATSGGALGSGYVTVNSGGILNLNAGAVTYTGLNSPGLNGSGIVNIVVGTVNSSTVFIENGYDSFSGTMNVGTNGLTGAVAAVGAGKVWLAPLASGATVNVLANATVYVTANSHPEAITLYGGTTGENYGQLRIDSGAIWSGSVTLAGPITTPGANQGTVGTYTGTGTISGAIGEINGSQSLIKVGGQTTVLSGPNTYSGGTFVNNGELQLLGNQSGATGGFNVGSGGSYSYLFMGDAGQNSPTTVAVASGKSVQVATSATQWCQLNTYGASGYPTYVTNNGSLLISRYATMVVGNYSSWYQNGDMTNSGNGGYPGSITVNAGGSMIYGGTDPIILTENGGSGNVQLIINGTFGTGAGFTMVDNGTSGAYPSLTLANGGMLSLSANIPQLITTNNGTGTAGKFLLGTNATISLGGFSTTNTMAMANIASTNIGSLIVTGPGTLALAGANTYSGNTTLNAGTLALVGSGTLVSTNIIIASGATFDVSGRSSTFTLGSSQVLSNTAPTAVLNGNLNTVSGAIALTYDGINPAFAVANGTLTLSGTTKLNINNTGTALTVGNYLLISTNVGGLVSGSVPSSVTLGGNGAVSPYLSLVVVGNELYLQVLSTNAYLTSLVVSNNTAPLTLNPTPGFIPNTAGGIYYTTNAFGQPLTVTVTNADTTATNTLTVNGLNPQLLTSGTPSSVLPTLPAGSNNVTVTVVSQSGTVINNYTVNVWQLPSTNAQLANLVITNSAGVLTLSPSFTTNYTGIYYATNVYGAGVVNVLVTNVDGTATNTLLLGVTPQQPLTNGIASSPLTLNVGTTNVVVQVVSQDLSQTNNYVVAVTQLGSTESPTTYLTSLVLSNAANVPLAFSPTSFQTNLPSGPYTATNSLASLPLTVTITNIDSNATNTLYVNNSNEGYLTNGLTSGALTGLIEGSNNVTVLTVSQDLSVTNSYTVNVTLLGTNALLSSLSLSPAGAFYPTSFNSGTTTYTATNSYTKNPVTVAATSVDANATLALSFTNGAYGAAVTNNLNAPNNTLSLNPPVNAVAVQVVSQDGSQTNVYTVNVLLQPSLTVPHLTNSVSAGNLNLSWPGDHLGYRLLTQTNNLNKGVSANINDWGTVPGSTNLTSTSITIQKTGVTNQYYRLVYP